MPETVKPYVEKIKITNFKCYKGEHTFNLSSSVNVFVGNNASGKSTLLEAIHLALTGIFQGRYVRNELSQYLFNTETVNEYLESLKTANPQEPPYVLIELYFKGSEIDEFWGNGNKSKKDAFGLWFKICFNDKFNDEYEELVKHDEISTIPIEYYDVVWESFARSPITPRSIPIKSALVDSSGSRSINGSDLYISRIVKDTLDAKDIVDVSQAHRKIRDSFMKDVAIIKINEKIEQSANLGSKKISLAVDLSVRNSWENSLTTYVDDIPFHFSGKGEQSVLKTKLALGHKKAIDANIIVLEEPENHLSHASLNELLYDIQQQNKQKQIIVSTHSSFVANKLGLDNITVLHNGTPKPMKDLDEGTSEFFEKIAGYDTLRLVLCKKAILVEGDSDELVVQRAYMQSHDNKLPIQDGIDIISVGTSFLRYLEIATSVGVPVSVVTDNDSKPESVKKKYSPYYDEKKSNPNLKICYDSDVDKGDLKYKGKPFNYNTLEPKMLKANGLEKMNTILGTSYKKDDDLLVHMRGAKTKTALAIFNYKDQITFPKYLTDSFS